MLEKIQFQNGTFVTREYLNEAQKGSSFSAPTTRDNYYAEPTEAEHSSWAIGQRDGLKDWEIADPRRENETGVGRLAHDGIVLNSYNPDTLEKVWGPPALVQSSVGNNTFGVWIEAGSIVGSDGNPISWPIQFRSLLSGTQTNYLFIDEASAKNAMAIGEPVEVSFGPSLPSAAQPHVPLAKLTLNPEGTSLSTNEDGDVVGAGYIDLRPNLYIGNLNTYPKILRNTEIINDSVAANSWERVIIDTSNGSLIVELPSNPTDSDRIAVVDISGTFDRFPVVIRPGADTKINGSVDDWIVNIKDAHLELFYHAATSEWKFEETPGGDCTPVLGSFLSCGGREFIGQRLASECPDGEVLPTTFPNPPEGVYRYEPSTQKCYREFYSTVAVYANGQGGLIKVHGAPRCDREGAASNPLVRNIIYVDPATGDDSISNNGFNDDKPFRSIERALIQAVRESRRAGEYNDRYDRVVIQLAPGDYYVDNFPGSGSTPGLTASTGLIQRIDTSFRVESLEKLDRALVLKINALNPSITEPPASLSLGRIIYSQSGGVGNIVKIEKESIGSSIWNVTLEYVRGAFNVNDELFYDGLSLVNPTSGGIIVPRGISIDGIDLRKVRVRPMYVPELNPVEAEPQRERTSIFKVTGGTYISLLTFADNPQIHRSHNTVTAVTFASQAEINGGGTETSYYSKINSLFSQFDGWGSQGVEPISAETTIVAPIADSKDLRQTDSEENQTGFPLPDSRPNAPIAYPGATRIRRAGSSDQRVFDLPDINSTRSSSPYIFNCSVRSIFGMNGLWADGALVSGFKSMVTANFTQVSLQTDPTCFNSQTYYQDPPVNKEDGSGKQYRVSPVDKFKYRHFGMRGSNNATIQIVSVFVIGNADHFVADSGADLSITNSCSDFGDISLRSIGYKTKSFSQDEGLPTTGYSGTRLLEIIPPLPLSYSPLPNTGRPTLTDTEINTGLVLDYQLTKSSYVSSSNRSVIKVYIRNSSSSSPFNSTTSVPSAERMGFGQFSYTRERSDGTYELVGGARQNRKQIRIKGFDELGNSIIYAGNIADIAAPLNSPGFEYLDKKSKIFIWDEGVQCWYINVITSNIDTQQIEQTDTDGDGFLFKKLDYAFRYAITSDPRFGSTDFIPDRSALTTIRGIDRRKNEERTYKIVLDGFSRLDGLRRPQNFYILEKQASVSGFPLNGSNELQEDPLTISQVRTYEEITGVKTFPDRYVAYLTLASQARKVPVGELYPEINADEPEATQDPVDSITRESLVEMLKRPGVYFNKPIEPSPDPILIKVRQSSTSQGIPIGLRRPSVIRSSGHTWEWTGYLNYDTAFPTFQGEPLDQDFALGKILVEETGGKVYATGMNEEGSFYIGTTVFDLRTGEQFAIPLEAGNEPGSVTNQVFNSVVIRSRLTLGDESSTYFGADSKIYFDPTTTFNSFVGRLSANQSPLPEVYATEDTAGLVQFANEAVIKGSRGGEGTGLAKITAISAASLARELNVRLDSVVSSGKGISIDRVLTNPEDGDPNISDDDVLSYRVSAGLPGNSDPVGFSGLALGEDPEAPTSIKLTNIRSSRDPLPVRLESEATDSAVVTEKGLAKWAKDIPGYVKSQGSNPYIVLHVARGNNPLTGAASVPAGYAETGSVSYDPNSDSIFRSTKFNTVTEALEFANQAYLPLGAELVISVHNSIDSIEAGPLMIANGWAPVVVAGARGSATQPVNPKIRLLPGAGANNTKLAGTRIPQLPNSIISAGIIFQDITIDVDTQNSGDLYLTLNGGFGVSGRDTVINWINCTQPSADNITALNSQSPYSQTTFRYVNATASAGEKTQVRVSSPVEVGEDKSIITNVKMGNKNQTTSVAFFDQAGGLLGQTCDIVFDFRSALYGNEVSPGGDRNSTLEFKFTHDSNNSMWLKMLGMGGRGNCRIASRIGPEIKWNFDNKDWNMRYFFAGFQSNPNISALSFKPVPYAASIYRISEATAQSISSSGPVIISNDCKITDATGNNNRAGVFSIYKVLAGRTISGVSLPSKLLDLEGKVVLEKGDRIWNIEIADTSGTTGDLEFKVNNTTLLIMGSSGDVEFAGGDPVLRSPNGTKYELKVNNSGVLSVQPQS